VRTVHRALLIGDARTIWLYEICAEHGHLLDVSTESTDSREAPGQPSCQLEASAMTGKRSANDPPPTSNAAVEKATGRTWAAWVVLLDSADGRTLDHAGIVKAVRERGDVHGWWAQMVAVGYERLTGRREAGETKTGYAVSASRTVGVSRERAFAAFDDPRLRRRWLPEKDIAIHKTSAPRLARVTWRDGAKSVSVNLWEKGADKCQIALNHGGLASAAEAKRVKAFWQTKLDALERLLEGTLRTR